jgi:anti-sigma factor RsiW
MKPHNSELISALLDGELTGFRRWLTKRHVNQCALCAAEYRRLHHVREMLAANPPVNPMSDSPEFFWSKVKREIQARGGQTVEVPVPTLSLTDWFGQHQLAVVSTVTTFVAVVGLSIVLRPSRPSSRPVAIIQPAVATVEHSSTFIPNTVATTIQATETEPAVIWVSGLPWTPDMEELKTEFSQLDS